MTDIFHGEWERYTPAVLPANAPPNTIFTRRKSDGKDWYEHAHNPENFTPSHVKIAVDWRESAGAWIVGAATRDETAIFPAGFRVYELTNYSGDDPQSELGSKAYDPDTGAFTEQVQPENPAQRELTDKLDMIMVRLDALEKK